MPGSRAPTCVRPAVATSRLVPQGKLDTVPHTQLVVGGSKTVLEDVLGGSNFTNDVPVTEALGDEGDDALFAVGRCDSRTTFPPSTGARS